MTSLTNSDIHTKCLVSILGQAGHRVRLPLEIGVFTLLPMLVRDMRSEMWLLKLLIYLFAKIYDWKSPMMNEVKIKQQTIGAKYTHASCISFVTDSQLNNSS